jgi:hypothetical protein
VLVFSSLDTAMAERWCLGVPDPAKSNLIHFQTPVPQDFVTKVMQQLGPNAPFGKSYQRKAIDEKEYLILEQKIGWHPNNANGDAVSFLKPEGVGQPGTWVNLSGPEWQAFKQTLNQISTAYPSVSDTGWRQAEPMVMKIPAGTATPVTLELPAGSAPGAKPNTITPFVAEGSPSEQLIYKAISPELSPFRSETRSRSATKRNSMANREIPKSPCTGLIVANRLGKWTCRGRFSAA